MTIGSKIKEVRIKKKITQDELAAAVGYNGKSMISRIENGRNYPSYDAIQRIANALDVNASYLLGMDAEDAEIIDALGKLNPIEELPEDVNALNVLLYGIGERIIRTGGEYCLGECGVVSDDDIAYIKESAIAGVKMAYEILRKRKEKELRNILKGDA